MATSTITLNHQINNNWSYNAVAYYQNYNKDFYGTERIQWNLQSKRRLSFEKDQSINKQYVEQNYGSLQFNVNGEFKTEKLTHKLLAGADADYLKQTLILINCKTRRSFCW